MFARDGVFQRGAFWRRRPFNRSDHALYFGFIDFLKSSGTFRGRRG